MPFTVLQCVNKDIIITVNTDISKLLIKTYNILYILHVVNYLRGFMFLRFTNSRKSEHHQILNFRNDV